MLFTVFCCILEDCFCLFRTCGRKVWILTTCFVVTNDELLCSSLRANNRSSRSIVIFFLLHNDVLVLTRETCLRRVRSSLRVNKGSPRSIVHLSLRTHKTLIFLSGFHPLSDAVDDRADGALSLRMFVAVLCCIF